MPRRMPMAVLAVAVVALAVSGCGDDGPETQPASAVPASTPAPSPASVFVSPTGSDDAACRSREAACATFQKAYEVADPGEVVGVAAGRYPAQQIVADPTKDAPEHVVFRPLDDGKVVLDGLGLGSGLHDDGPRHLTVERMHTSFIAPGQQRSVAAYPGTRDLVLADIDAGNFNLWGVQRVTVRGGDWGPCAIGPEQVCGNSRIDSGPPSSPTRDVLIDGARFHDYRFAPECFDEGADCHFECMYVNASENVTIRGSSFRDCALYDVFVTISGPDAGRVGHRGLRIVNNWFDTPWDESGPGSATRARSGAVALTWCESSPQGYDDVLIGFNSFQPTTGIELEAAPPSCRFENVLVVGNLMAWDGCEPRWSYAHNVWSDALRSGTCDPTDRIAGPSFPYTRAASGPGLDFHLARPVATVPEGCPALDVDGARRPARGCAAGSDEPG